MKKQKNLTKQTIRWFWYFTKPDKKLFFASSTLAGLAIVIQDTIPPLIMAAAFNELERLYSSNSPVNFWQLDHFAWMYIAFLVVGLFLWRIQVIFAWIFEIRSMKRISEKVFAHIQSQSAAFHANRFGGALVSYTNKFLGAYERLADEFTWSIVTGVVSLVSSTIVLAFVTWQYAIIYATGALLYLAVMSRRTMKQLEYDRKLADSESITTAKLADAITNVGTIRSFASEKLESKLFKSQTDKQFGFHMKLMRVAMTNEALSHVSTMTINILAFVGGMAIITYFNAPLGVLFLAINYTMVLSRRLWESNKIIRNINRSLGDAYRMTEILAIEPDVSDSEGAKRLIVKRGDIQLRNVTFAYPENKSNPLFKDLNLHIKQGEKIGLVGHSGGGKTTITQLLLRFMDIQDGNILIDGQDISKVTQISLRSNIAYVPQEPLLFHRSLTENITYGNQEADHHAIEGVAKLAHAHEFISQLPEGYETLVGERGVKLSGGQRQRVAIARAMLKNAPILVLDEATSALDSESEKLIQDALKKLMENRTTIVIAHRLSTIQKMDRIVVLDNGKIVEQGSHQELLKNKGTYAKLWSHQSGGFLEE